MWSQLRSAAESIAEDITGQQAPASGNTQEQGGNMQSIPSSTESTSGEDAEIVPMHEKAEDPEMAKIMSEIGDLDVDGLDEEVDLHEDEEVKLNFLEECLLPQEDDSSPINPWDHQSMMQELNTRWQEAYRQMEKKQEDMIIDQANLFDEQRSALEIKSRDDMAKVMEAQKESKEKVTSMANEIELLKLELEEAQLESAIQSKRTMDEVEREVKKTHENKVQKAVNEAYKAFEKEKQREILALTKEFERVRMEDQTKLSTVREETDDAQHHEDILAHEAEIQLLIASYAQQREEMVQDHNREMKKLKLEHKKALKQTAEAIDKVEEEKKVIKSSMEETMEKDRVVWEDEHAQVLVWAVEDALLKQKATLMMQYQQEIERLVSRKEDEMMRALGLSLNPDVQNALLEVEKEHQEKVAEAVHEVDAKLRNEHEQKWKEYLDESKRMTEDALEKERSQLAEELVKQKHELVMEQEEAKQVAIQEAVQVEREQQTTERQSEEQKLNEAHALEIKDIQDRIAEEQRLLVIEELKVESESIETDLQQRIEGLGNEVANLREQAKLSTEEVARINSVVNEKDNTITELTLEIKKAKSSTNSPSVRAVTSAARSVTSEKEDKKIKTTPEKTSIRISPTRSIPKSNSLKSALKVSPTHSSTNNGSSRTLPGLKVSPVNSASPTSEKEDKKIKTTPEKTSLQMSPTRSIPKRSSLKSALKVSPTHSSTNNGSSRTLPGLKVSPLNSVSSSKKVTVRDADQFQALSPLTTVSIDVHETEEWIEVKSKNASKSSLKKGAVASPKKSASKTISKKSRLSYNEVRSSGYGQMISPPPKGLTRHQSVPAKVKSFSLAAKSPALSVGHSLDEDTDGKAKIRAAMPPTPDRRINPSTLDPNEIRIMVLDIPITGLRKIAQRVGAKIIEDLEDAWSATHVIAGDNDTSMRRTPKLMIALSCTPHILHMDWLRQCAKEKTIASTRNYVILDDHVAEKKYNFSMKHTLVEGNQRRKEGGLFFGWTILFAPGVAGNRAPRKKALELIVQAAGGIPVFSPEKPLMKDEESKARVIVITSDPPTEKQTSYPDLIQVSQEGAGFLTTTWLFDCITRQKFLGTK
eukprot:scaffold41317_cov47-Attheya_sp.AAC.6